MRRVLLAGAGEAGGRHLAALEGAAGLAVAGIADPAPRVPLPAGVPVFGSGREALEVLAPDLVVVAAPPGTALAVARDAAASGAMVLVEKPAAVDPAALAPQPGDDRVFVAFQPHFAPGLEALLAGPPAAVRADVSLKVRRDPGYFRDWRRCYATAGGVLHQQAIHGLALALRLVPGDAAAIDAAAERHRGLAETEDRVTAVITLDSGAAVHVRARVDYPGPPSHEVALLGAGGSRLRVRGRNLEAGLGPLASAPSHEELRRAMYAAALAAAGGGPPHPCLFPLPELRRLLEVIDRVYEAAGVARAPGPAAA